MKHNERGLYLLVLGLVFGFILGGFVSGVVYAVQPKVEKTIVTKPDELYTDDGQKIEYWVSTDSVTSTDFAVAKLGEKELIIELVDFDGNPKAKSSANSDIMRFVESNNQYYILEDTDTGIQYMISHSFTTYRVRTLETGMPYCNKSI